jgi:HEAT repeat protein
MLTDRSQEKHWIRLIQALGNLGDRGAIPTLRPFLKDPKERRRIYSVVALAALRDTASVPAFCGLLDDSLLTVRSAASNALVGFSHPAAEILAAGPGSVSARGPNAAVRLRTLGVIAAAIPDTAGAEALHTRGIARSALMDILDNPSDPREAPERAAAVRALCKLGDPETLSFLRARMLDEADPLVRRTYQKALKDAEDTGKR